jgi:hypothetical protein
MPDVCATRVLLTDADGKVYVFDSFLHPQIKQLREAGAKFTAETEKRLNKALVALVKRRREILDAEASLLKYGAVWEGVAAGDAEEQP